LFPDVAGIGGLVGCGTGADPYTARFSAGVDCPPLYLDKHTREKKTNERKEKVQTR